MFEVLNEAREIFLSYGSLSKNIELFSPMGCLP